MILFLIGITCSARSLYIKGTSTEGTCIAGTYIGRAYTGGTYTSSTYIKDTYTGFVSDKGACTRSVYIVEHSGMHL